MNKEKFFNRNRNIVNRVIRGRLAKTKRIVHGTRATRTAQRILDNPFTSPIQRARARRLLSQ